MNNLSDLELEKRIAEIEGKTFVNYFGDPFVQNGITLTSYNLLTDKAMLWDLMFKHDISICRYQDFVYIESNYTDKPHKASISFSSKEELPRAVLECIVEANNESNSTI